MDSPVGVRGLPTAPRKCLRPDALRLPNSHLKNKTRYQKMTGKAKTGHFYLAGYRTFELGLDSTATLWGADYLDRTVGFAAIPVVERM